MIGKIISHYKIIEKIGTGLDKRDIEEET